MERKNENPRIRGYSSLLTRLRKGPRTSSLLTVASIVIIITSVFLVNLVESLPLPIGDAGYLQSNPFESNPTNGATSGVVGLVGTIALAKDGLVNTQLNWRIGGSTTVAYVQMTPFENAPPTTFTVGWVDIKVCYRSSATTDDRYRIVYQVGTSSWQDLQAWISGSGARFDRTGSQDERVWSNVAEPNDGIWDWTDIGNLRVRVETQRVGYEDSMANRFYLYEVWLTIYEGAYPATGPNLSIQPPLVHGLHAGDYFFVDVFATNVVKMYGDYFFVTYNPHTLTVVDSFTYYPFGAMAISEASDITYLHVNQFDNIRLGWERTGTPPYLKKVDYPGKYISETTDGSTIGDFSFSDTSSPNYGGAASIELNAMGDGDDQVEIWLYDGIAWTLADTVTPPAGALDWVSSVDVGSILSTTDKINNAKVYLVKKTVGTPSAVTVDAMRLSLATGYATLGMGSVPPDWDGLTGTGPVARLYFQVVADGMSWLHLCKTKMATIYGERVTHTSSDGLFITAFRDVAVKSITCSPTGGYSGYVDINIGVEVENQGEISETFDVTTYYNSNPIETRSITLGSGETTTVPFTWNTEGVAQGNYAISATVGPLGYEFDLTDNSLSDGTINLRTPGDVNADGIVDIVDVSGISAHWYPGPPEGPLGYAPNFDINNDGAVDILEISIISAYWTGPPKGPKAP